VDKATKSGIQSSIYSVSLTAKVPTRRLVVRSANQVFADGDQLRVMLKGKLVKWDPSLGAAVEAEEALDAGCGGFFGEGVAVVCHGEGSQLSIVTQDGSKTELDASAFAEGGEPASTGYLYANARWVGFTVNANRGYIFDVARKSVFRLKGVSNSPQQTFVDHWVPNKQDFIRAPYPKKLQFFELTTD
jgi:hypothetical protein